MLRAARLLALLLPAAAAQPYAPPDASARLVTGVPFRAAVPVGSQFRARFTECDTRDSCDGKKLTFGCSQDPNRNTVLLSLPGNVIFYDAKMGLDADGSPYSKRTPGRTDQPETSFPYRLSGRPSVDADKVPFIVVPGRGFAALQIQMGDIAAVVYKDHLVFALVADEGPPCKLGEGSIQLHELLGHAVCTARNEARECTKLRDVGIERNVLYFVFAGSRARIFSGLTPANVNERLATEGAKLMSALKQAH